MRPQRTPAGAIALALALAVGLGALLVGLSVAPKVLPGDTFRVVPRTIDVAAADNDPTNDRAHALPKADGAISSHAVPLAIVSGVWHAVPYRWPLGLRAPTVEPLTDHAVPRPGCRGPPHC